VKEFVRCEDFSSARQRAGTGGPNDGGIPSDFMRSVVLLK
jgi:hypothetical protein